MGKPLFDVAIVGFGPVGATLANLLGSKGWRVVVFDRDDDVYPLPRACHLDDTSLRVLQSVGLADPVLAESIPSLGMDMLDRRGRSFLTFAADHESNVFGFPTSVLFWQPSFEATLRAGVNRYQTVKLQLGSEVVGLSWSDDGWLVEASGPGELMPTAKFVVGCDGAKSFTRGEIGAGLVDLDFDQHWLVVDVELTDSAQLPDRIVQYCDPGRPATFVPLPGSFRRWELMALPGEDLTELSRGPNVQALLEPWLPSDHYRIVRSAVYRFHGLVADRWHRGGIFLAGDAAHQMPPFLGQGLCSGIRDVGNLAWKLDLVLREQASPDLLGSYEEERAPHVARLADRTISIGRMIQVTEEEAASEETLAQRTIRGDSGAAPLTSGLIAEDSLGAGELFPQPDLGTGPLDEALGEGFALVTAREVDISSADLPLVQADALQQWFDRRRADFAVVRPDRYVYATGRKDDLERVLDELSARLAGTPAP